MKRLGAVLFHNAVWLLPEDGATREAFEWLLDEPVAYSSSRGIEWLHCHHCGSLVGYRRSSRPDHMDITTGTLDDPGLYPPTAEIWLGHKIGWEILDPNLPKFAESSDLNAPQSPTN